MSTKTALGPAELKRMETAVAEIRAAQALAEKKAARPAEFRPASMARHHSYLAAPAWIAAADSAALLGHLIPFPWAAYAIGTSSAVIGARSAWRNRKRHRSVRWQAAGYWAAGSATALGGAAAGVGSPLAQGLLLGGGAVAAAPWLRAQRKRFRTQGPPPPGEKAAATGPRIPPQVAAFREAFCLKDGPLAFADPGGYAWCPEGGDCKFSAEGPLLELAARTHKAETGHEPEVVAFSPITNGFRLGVQLVRGKQTTGSVSQIHDRICSLYDVPWEQVAVEHGRSRSRSRADVSVITNSRQFTEAQMWAGSTLDLDEGIITAGWFGDSEPARYRFWKPGSGAAHCIATGSTGSGKSGFLSLLLAEAGVAVDAEGRRLIRRWILDPQAQSLPGWTGRVDLTALGTDSSMAALRSLYAALLKRSARLGNTPWIDSKGREIRGVGRFRPTWELPLMLVILDEMHLLLQHRDYAGEAEYILSQIGKLGRKAGMALVVGNQLAGLAEMKSRALRQSLAAMQAVAFRSAENLNATFLGIQGQPFHLPSDIGGLGYINSVDHRSAATFRSVWVGEEEAEVDAAEMGGLLPLDAAFAKDIANAARVPHAVPGSPKWLPSWEYTGEGQVLRDAA